MCKLHHHHHFRLSLFFHACVGQTVSQQWHSSILHDPVQSLSSVPTTSYHRRHIPSTSFYLYLVSLSLQLQSPYKMTPNSLHPYALHDRTTSICSFSQPQQCFLVLNGPRAPCHISYPSKLFHTSI